MQEIVSHVDKVIIHVSNLTIASPAKTAVSN